MSRVLASAREPGVPLEIVTACLRGHPWVKDALPSGRGSVAILLVPSAEGLGVLRRRGRGRLLAEWERHLRGHGIEHTAHIDLRLIEALPAEGRDARPVDAALPWMPLVSELVVDAASRSLTCRLLVPYDMPVFRGHFPAVPVVPGVMQVGWAAELAREHGLIEGPLAGIESAKFRRLVQPGMHLAARLEQGARKGQLCFTFALGDAVIANGRLQFGNADD